MPECPTPEQLSMARRLLDEPCSRWEPEEVLDLARIVLMSLKWPTPEADIGSTIARAFLDSPAGRGRSPLRRDLLSDELRSERRRFMQQTSRERRSKLVTDRQRQLARGPANMAMMDAVSAFLAVERGRNPHPSTGLIGSRMPRPVANDIARAKVHAETILSVLERRTGAPWRKQSPGPSKHAGLQFTSEMVEKVRADLSVRRGSRVTDRDVAEEMRALMSPKNRPTVRAIQNRISKLRHVEADARIPV